MSDSSSYEQLKSILNTETSPQLGPNPRPGVLGAADVRQQVDALLAQTRISGVAADLIRSLALLWHDHLDESHQLSQSISSSDGSYVHGIMHRREPDLGNAAYWFRRVGDHPIYPELASEVAGLGGTTGFTSRLVVDHRWNPFAMIDACEAVDVGSDDEGDEDCLRRVQSIEFHLLLKRFCGM